MEVLIFLVAYLILYILVKKIIIDHWFFTPIIAVVMVLFIFKPFTIVDDGIVIPNVIEAQE